MTACTGCGRLIVDGRCSHPICPRQAKLDRVAQARARWSPITVRGTDVTEHVAAMFDALVASLDWGSDFLDDDAINSILTVADLAGFEIPSTDSNVQKWRAQNAARESVEANEPEEFGP